MEKLTPENGKGGAESFTLPHRDAVREENWAEYAARGFRFVVNATDEQSLLMYLRRMERLNGGAEFVYTGDPYDREQCQPLRNMPGRGIYLHPDAPILRQHGYWEGAWEFTTPLSGRW